MPEELRRAVVVSLELLDPEDPEAAQPHRTPTDTAIIAHLITPDRIETRISLPLLDARSSCAQISASWRVCRNAVPHARDARGPGLNANHLPQYVATEHSEP